MTIGQITTFDNAFFDINVFDTEYNTTFLASSRTDIQNIIIEHGIVTTLIRQVVVTDGSGTVIDAPETEYNIFVSIQDITKKDRLFLSGITVNFDNTHFLNLK